MGRSRLARRLASEAGSGPSFRVCIRAGSDAGAMAGERSAAWTNFVARQCKQEPRCVCEFCVARRPIFQAWTPADGQMVCPALQAFQKPFSAIKSATWLFCRNVPEIGLLQSRHELRYLLLRDGGGFTLKGAITRFALFLHYDCPRAVMQYGQSCAFGSAESSQVGESVHGVICEGDRKQRLFSERVQVARKPMNHKV